MDHCGVGRERSDIKKGKEEKTGKAKKNQSIWSKIVLEWLMTEPLMRFKIRQQNRN